MNRKDALLKYDLVLEDLLDKIEKKVHIRPSTYAISVKIQYRFMKALIELGYVAVDVNNIIISANYRKRDIEETVDKVLKRAKELNREYITGKVQGKGAAESKKMEESGMLNLSQVEDRLTDIFLLAKKFNIEECRTKEFMKDIMLLMKR